MRRASTGLLPSRRSRLALDAATRVRRPIAEHNQLKAVFGLHAALALTGEQALDSGARVQGTEQIANGGRACVRVDVPRSTRR